MSALTFEIKDGKLIGREWLWHALKRVFMTIKSDGRYVWPLPEKEKKQRSKQQNRYYFGVVCKLAGDYCGYEQDEMHQEFAKKFLSYEKDGKTFVKSTTKLKTKEFEDYMEKCRMFAAEEFRCYIPLPNEPHNYYYDMDK